MTHTRKLGRWSIGLGAIALMSVLVGSAIAAANDPQVDGATNDPQVDGATNDPQVDGATNGPQVDGATNELTDPQTDEGHNIITGGPIRFKRVVTDRAFRTTNSEEFVPLANAGPAGGAYVPVPAGRSALINVRFTAESRCNEPNGAGEPNWCEVRILIGGIEGFPQASSFPPDTFALDSTDNGTETFASWEAHAFDRHLCYRNDEDQTVRVPVQVEWKVTNFGGGTAPDFWLDDWSLSIERSDRCRVDK